MFAGALCMFTCLLSECQTVVLSLIRKSIDQVCTKSSKISSLCNRRLSDTSVGNLYHNLWPNVASRNASVTGISSPVSPQRSNTGDFLPSHVATASINSSNNYSRGFTQEPKREPINYNLRLNIPSRSAPTSVFSSPDVSPRRSNGGDLFPSHVASQDFHDSHAGFFAMGSPMKTPLSPDHSPLHSPVARSSLHNPKSPNGVSLYLQHRSLPQTIVERPESNYHVTAHPLPLPPGAAVASPSATTHHILENPYVPSMKGQWQKGKLIGRGTFGSVYLATNMYASISKLSPDLHVVLLKLKSFLYFSIYFIIFIYMTGRLGPYVQ